MPIQLELLGLLECLRGIEIEGDLGVMIGSVLWDADLSVRLPIALSSRYFYLKPFMNQDRPN